MYGNDFMLQLQYFGKVRINMKYYLCIKEHNLVKKVGKRE